MGGGAGIPSPARRGRRPQARARALPPAPLGTRRRRPDGPRAGHAQSPRAGLASRKPVRRRRRRAGPGARRARDSLQRRPAGGGPGPGPSPRPARRGACSLDPSPGRGGPRPPLTRRLPRPGRVPEPSGMEPWKQCAQWLIHCKVLPANHRVTWDSAQVFDLAQTLRDGVLLCQLLNNLRARSINLKEINLRPQMSQVRRPARRLRLWPASPITHRLISLCKCRRVGAPGGSAPSLPLGSPLGLFPPWLGMG